MGTIILRGISTSLLVTIITLLAGLLWNAMGFGGLTASNIVDIGLVASCLMGGYRAGKESGSWGLGGVVGGGYVGLGILLLSLFLPLQSWGIVKVLGEGAGLGLVAGAWGASTARGGNKGLEARRRPYSLSWAGPQHTRGAGWEKEWDEWAETGQASRAVVNGEPDRIESKAQARYDTEVRLREDDREVWLREDDRKDQEERETWVERDEGRDGKLRQNREAVYERPWWEQDSQRV